MRDLWIFLLAACLAGCYQSHALSDTPDAGTPTCGNGIVEAPEECDGNVGSCTGSSNCPGFRVCRSNCTFSECLDGGFGNLTWPTLLATADNALAETTRTSTSYTGSRFGVTWSGIRAGGPGQWKAPFATVDLWGNIDVAPHDILPDVYGIGEAHAAWAPEMAQFGFAMIAMEDVTRGMLNFADPSGWVLVDPGVALASGPVSDVFLGSGPDGYGISWVAGSGTHQVWFGEYSHEMEPIQIHNLSGDSPILINWKPRVLTMDGQYTVLWHADDVGGTNRSYLMMQQVPPGPPPLPDPVDLFTEMQVRPPFAAAVAGSEILVVFSVQPYFDAQVLDLYLARVSGSGDVTLPPVLVGTVRRAAYRDVDVAWSGSELGVIAATPPGEDPSPRNLTFHRLDMYGEAISPPVQLSWSRDVTMPSTTWDGEAWGITYAITSEDDEGWLDVQFVRVGCIPPD